MKRGLVFSLCAVALAAIVSTAQAQTVTLSLNLRYFDPADPSEGGQWFLMGKATGTAGLAGVSAYLADVTAPTASNANDAVVNGNPVVVGALGAQYPVVSSANIAAMVDAEGDAFATLLGSVINATYGQNTSAGPIVLDVGDQASGTAAGNVAVDPLQNTAWNNSSLLLSGTFAGVRPSFTTTMSGTPPVLNETDANVLPVGATTTPPANASLNAATTAVVRGDAIRNTNGTPLNYADDTSIEGPSLGLFPGDANRDGRVLAADLSILLSNFNGTNRTWDQGNFNDDVGGAGVVNASDLSFLLSNFNADDRPVSVAAVPEPSTLLLAVGASLLSLVARRRRS